MIIKIYAEAALVRQLPFFCKKQNKFRQYN